MNAHRLSMKATAAVLALVACLALMAACGGGAKSPAKTPSAGQTPAAGSDFRLTSEAFGPDEQIPVIHTCDGHNTSPPLAWDGAPAETQSFALIMDDPDAPGGTFTHWVLYNMQATATGLPEGVDTIERPANGAAGSQGDNDGGGTGYGGPCPPPGDPHRYRFTLYALDAAVDLDRGVSKEQLPGAMQGHILAQAELAGTYGR